MPDASTSTPASASVATKASAIPLTSKAPASRPAPSSSWVKELTGRTPWLRTLRAQNATEVFDNIDCGTSISPDASDSESSKVIYHSTATHPLAPTTGDAFALAYGREPTNADYDSHKMGLAGLGRYGKGHRSHVLMYGQAFVVKKKERSAGYVDSSFQTKDGDERRKAIKTAKTKASMTAARFNRLLAEDGLKIVPETKTKKILHSEQLSVRIPLDKNGNVMDGQDHTGSFLPNLTMHEIEGETTANSPRSRHDSVNSTPQTSVSRNATPPSPDAPSPSPSLPLLTENVPPLSPADAEVNSQQPQPIPALEPSDRDDVEGYSEFAPKDEDEKIYSKYIVSRVPHSRLREDHLPSPARTPEMRERRTISPSTQHPPSSPREIAKSPATRKRKSCDTVEPITPQGSKRHKTDQVQEDATDMMDAGPSFAHKDASNLSARPQSLHSGSDDNKAMPRTLSKSTDARPATPIFQRRDGFAPAPRPARSSKVSKSEYSSDAEISNSKTPPPQVNAPRVAAEVVPPKQQQQSVVINSVPDAVSKSSKIEQQEIAQQLKKKPAAPSNRLKKKPEQQHYSVRARLHGAQNSNVQASRGNYHRYNNDRYGRHQDRHQRRREENHR
ncbi:hypothetical protein FB567DRAFT_597366 [Paraphoma chrysanthemicola]|uniref:Uncharacterized protein n=1 Tax=Paraphoma chrysanthemicola TaxID=798071 RepID=A0A8K0QY35_9PLEO|nr:hypothetical protein FB567DRAFT_597366 [Paraphoma chrysanthemicola]